jgi:hypothetical protein
MASQSRRQKRQMLKTLGLLGNKTASQKTQAKQIMNLLSNMGSGINNTKVEEAEIVEAEVINENINDEADGTK